MPNLKKGYLPPAVLLFLAGLTLFVAAIIVFNAQLIKNVQKPSGSTASSPIPANWKTYTNNAYGYSLKFPSDFTKSYENSTSILFDGRTGSYQEGSKILNGISLDLTVSKYPDIPSTINAYKQDIANEKSVTIGDGIAATQVHVVTPNTQEDLYTYVQLPKGEVLVIRIFWTEKNSGYYSKLATQILSTFTLSPSNATLSWKTYNWHGYQIEVPSQYEKKEQNNQLSFNDIIQKNVKEKTVAINEQRAKYMDPCSQKPIGYLNAHCTTINGYRAMDWGSEIPPLPMGPLTFEYTMIHNNTEYRIVFLDLEQSEKDQILSTFHFTN